MQNAGRFQFLDSIRAKTEQIAQYLLVVLTESWRLKFQMAWKI